MCWLHIKRHKHSPLKHWNGKLQKTRTFYEKKGMIEKIAERKCLGARYINNVSDHTAIVDRSWPQPVCIYGESEPLYEWDVNRERGLTWEQTLQSEVVRRRPQTTLSSRSSVLIICVCVCVEWPDSLWIHLTCWQLCLLFFFKFHHQIVDSLGVFQTFFLLQNVENILDGFGWFLLHQPYQWGKGIFVFNASLLS